MPTAGEVEAIIRDIEDQIRAGVCPYCKHTVGMRQVGCCVYGECGHRLYCGELEGFGIRAMTLPGWLFVPQVEAQP